MHCYRSPIAPLAWAVLLALSCSNPTGVDRSAGTDIASVSVDPSASTVLVGAEVPLRASVTDVDGNAVPSATIVWSVRDAAIASVSATGVVTARAVGTTQVAASSGGHSAVATITVQPPPVASVAVQPGAPSLVVGESVTLTAVVADANGAPLTNRAVTWTSSDSRVATVTAAGLVTAIGPGTASIVATSEGRTGVATVAVVRAPVLAVTVAPAALGIATGQTLQLTLTVEDANHVVVTDREVKWTSSDDLVASVSPTGLVTARGSGVATVTATSEGKSGSTRVTVSPAAVSTVVVAPGSVTIQTLRSTTLTAIGKDANGNVVAGRPVKWESSSPLVASVTDAGVVTGLLPGTATISATIDGKTGSGTVNVTLVPVGTVAIRPKPVPALVVGQTTPLSVVVTDANGDISNRAVTWSSDNTAIATVVPETGVVTALAPGQATITATSEGKSDAVVVTVTRPPVATVDVQPTSSILAVGQTLTATATTRDANGVVLPGRVVAWSSSNPNVAMVSTQGVVTAVAPGTSTITATSEGKSGTAAFTVIPSPVGSVSLAPNATSVAIGQTTTLVATVKDSRGVTVTDRSVVWTSSNPLVATVSNGVVTGVAVGSVTITATSEGKSGTATVTVTAVPVASVVVQPSTANLFVGQTRVLLATVTDANGTVVSDRPITWSTSDPLVATVSASGVVTAIAPGSVTISASAGGKSGSAGVVVTLVPVGSVVLAPSTATVVAGLTTTLVPTVRDVNGAVVTGRAITWTTSNAAVATVSAAGVVTAVTPGTATITATSEGKSGDATVAVTPVPVGSVVVAPAAKSVAAGGTTTLVATVRDANGSIVTDRAVTWSTSDPLVATVSSTGVVTAVAPGSATITATSETKSGSSTITVTPAPVGSVSLPATTTLVAGQSTTLTPIVKDANGAVVTDRVVTWTSSNTNVATVSSSGLVRALVTGTATITATSEGKSGSTALSVTPAPVGSVTVAPFSFNLPSSSSVTLTTTVKDVNGTTVTDRVVTWQSSDTNVATVSSDGVVNGLLVGTATITATSEGRSGTATVTVVPGPAATVTVTPRQATVEDGSTVQLTATAVDAHGNAIRGRPFNWRSLDGTRASVSSNGLVTANRAGTVTITVTLDGAMDSSQVTVTP